jgi:hypothetical protein
MRLKQADSASILRTPVGEIIWHTFSPLVSNAVRRDRSGARLPITRSCAHKSGSVRAF